MEGRVILCVFVLFMLAGNGFAKTEYETEWMMHWPRIPFPWPPPLVVERCWSAFHHIPSCIGEIRKALRSPNEAVIISDKCCEIVVEIDEECFARRFLDHPHTYWLMHHCRHHNPAPTPSDPAPASFDSVPEPPTPTPSDPAPATTPTPIDFAPAPDADDELPAPPVAGGDLPAPTPMTGDDSSPALSPSPFASYYF